MSKKTKFYSALGVLVAVLIVALATVGCGGNEESSTTATAPTVQTTAAGGVTTTAMVSGTTTAGPATGEPIKIGLSISLTGAGAAPGQSFDKGVKLQIDYVNQTGGIDGRPLELIEYDDKSDVPTVVANLNKLIQQDKVFATVGPSAQFSQEAARQVAEQNKVPMVGCGPATLDQLKGTQYQWSVMTAAGPPTQADAVDKVIKASGWNNVLGLSDVLNIDQETLEVVSQAASKGGYTFTKMKDTFGLDQQDFQPILNKMMEQMSAVQPDSIVLYVNPIAFPAIYKGLRGLNVTLPILAGTACAHPSIFAQGPQAVEGTYVMDSGGMVNPEALPDSWPMKALQLDFAERYQAKYNEAPDFFSANGADLIIVLAEAMKQAGEIDRAKVAQALINLKDVLTLEGTVTFTPDATSMGIHGGMVEWQVKNGQFVLINTVN